MAEHALVLKTNRRLLHWCAWAYHAACPCGWFHEMGGQPLFTTKKQARKAYYQHCG